MLAFVSRKLVLWFWSPIELSNKETNLYVFNPTEESNLTALEA
jgi:hypothetical protein